MKTALCILAIAFFSGCSEKGTSRLSLNGEVKLDGQPIPFGEVLLTPDGAKGNSGPQGIAPIADGKYNTNTAGGKGYAGGPTIIRVTGFDGPGGKLICEYEISVDLPRGSGTHNIDLPKKAAVAAGKQSNI